MRTGLVVRIAGFLVACALVAAAPGWISDFRTSQLAFVGLYFVAVVGLDVLVGYSGQISLGHGAFMTVGGYTTAILMTHHGLQDWQTIPVAAVVAGLAGLAFGIPALRLRGLYLALATFGVAVALPSILKKWSSLTGGSTGINLFGVPTQTGRGLGPTIAGHRLTQNEWLYALSWSVALLLFVLAWLVVRSRFGRNLQALRDSEVAAASSGVDPARHKVLAFGFSAAYAGVAGALYAIDVAYVSPDTFQIGLSLVLLVGAVVGGLGSLPGAVLGAVLIEFLPFWSQGISKQAPSVIYGAVIVALMLILPAGLGGLSATLSRLWSRISPSSSPPS